jgi:O-antigen/teichoic acid export membrane protein
VINQGTKEGLYTLALVICGLTVFIGFIYTLFGYWSGGTIVYSLCIMIIAVLIFGALSVINQGTKEGLYTLALMVGELTAGFLFIITLWGCFISPNIYSLCILIIEALILGAIATVYWYVIKPRRYSFHYERALHLMYGVEFE